METTPPLAPPLPDQRDRPEHRVPAPWTRLAGIVRVVSHAIVWIAVLVPMVAELSRGWRAYSDNAAIAARAYQSLSLHPPLVGMTTVAGSGHVLFDPGPLMFYLLAVPVHIDPTRGLFWGAALLCGAVLSVAIEAAWSAGQWAVGAVMAFTALDLLWLTPLVFENLVWNAYFPVPFFMAAVVLAWVVALGRVRWWPVLVVVASVAAQSHLTFVIPAVGLTVVAAIFGFLATDRPRRLKWLVVGAAVGFLCWLPPLLQEVGNGRGNLSALAGSDGGRATFGVGFGLRLLGAAGSLHPLWLTHLPTSFFSQYALEHGHAPWLGGLLLVLLVIITVVALATGRRRLGALGAVTLVVAASEVLSFAVFPSAEFLSLAYLIDSLWVISILLWVFVMWGLVSAGQWVWRRYSQGARATRATQLGLGSVARIRLAVVVVSLGVLAVIGFLGLKPAVKTPSQAYWQPQVVRRDDRAAQAVERMVSPGPVAIEVGPPSLDSYLSSGVAEGVAYRLKVDGWRPGISSPLAYSSGFTIPPDGHWPIVRITLTGSRGLSVVRVP